MYGFRRPTYVRTELAKAAARSFLKQMGIKGPPVPVKKLLKKLGRLFYFNNSQSEDFSEEEGFSRLVRDIYYIYINKDLPNGRDSFTYAHEIAHIILKHHKEFDVDNLSDREMWILDREADIFAANLLMPKKWVRANFSLPVNVPEIGRLKSLFNVSWGAINNRLDELNLCSKIKINQLFTEWREKESSFIYFPKNNSIHRLDGVNYCTSRKVRGKTKLVGPFKIPETDEDNRFLKCPMCGNSEFSWSARFCKKCGQYLYNDCLNSSNDPRKRTEECGQANVPDALFCEYCGSKTMVYELLEGLGFEEVAVSNDEDDVGF